MYIYPTHVAREVYDTRKVFKAEYNWFEFRIFLLLDWLPYQGKKVQSALLFSCSWDSEIPFKSVFVLYEIQRVLTRV